MTQEMYSKLCATLTEFEHPEEFEDTPNDDGYWVAIFYDLLVEIQNDSEFA